MFVKVAYHKIYSGPMAIPIDPPVELPQVADTGNLFDNIPLSGFLLSRLSHRSSDSESNGRRSSPLLFYWIRYVKAEETDGKMSK